MGTVTLGLSGQVCAGPDPGAGAPGRGRRVPRDRRGDRRAWSATATRSTRRSPSSPLINTRQLDRVLGLIGRGQAEGARLVCGGTRGDGDLAAGNFVAPTLFADVTNDMTIAREEIFGPVLSVIPFADEDEAVRIANDTEYGLAATVWTWTSSRAMRMTKALRAGHGRHQRLPARAERRRSAATASPASAARGNGFSVIGS